MYFRISLFKKSVQVSCALQFFIIKGGFQMKVNGILMELDNLKSDLLTDLLDMSGYDSSRIAVEINGRIIPRSEYESTVLFNEDIIEIVSFVGGG